MTLRWHALPVLALVATALAAQEPTATLSGAVTDAETGRPLDGAVVLVSGTLLRAVTDERGAYRLTDIAPGRYDVRVTLLGYQSVVRPDVPLERGAVRQLDIALARAIIDLPAVVVSARRAEERPGDSPASVAVLTHDAVVHRGAITIDQALPFVPGVIFNNGAMDIRGASGLAGGVGSRVLMLLDGHPILTGDGAEVDFNAVPTLDLDRVEIVKGAYSALYGSNALGGVVNVITTPIGRFPETVVAAHGGFYDTPAAVRYTSHDLGTEDVDVQHSRRFGDVGARVALRRERSDGFEQDGWLARWMGRAKVTWPADDPHASSAYAMVTSEDDGNHFVWLSDSQPYAVDPASAADWSRAQKLILGATLNALATASALFQVNPYIYYNTLQNHFHDNQDHHRATRVGTEVQLGLNPWLSHAFTFGGDVSRTWVGSNFLGRPVLDDGALYAEDEIAFSPRVQSSLGARVDYHDASGSAAEYSFSPKVGVVFKPAPAVSTRAWIGHGFRAPAAIEQFVSTTMAGFQVVPNPALKSETAWSGEVGVTASRGGWLWLDAALFDSEYRDLIAPGTAGLLVFQFQNVQRARVRGLDLSEKLGLVGGLVGVEASYTYLDTKDLATGEPLPYRSRHNATLTLVGLGNLVGLDVRYRSQVQRVLAYPADPLPAKVTIVDLRLGYRVLGTDVQVKVSNLGQAAYVDVMERNRGAPRSVLFTAYRSM
ncbi:MAG TPA: TonB-dependent receptor [Gemmatimonadales bacterium]|nr:TonB-dependent receptor [Gemmatimonadales bacterium]